MTTSKKIYIGVGIAVVLIALFGYKWFTRKTEAATIIFKNLSIKPVGIRNLSLQNTFLKFNLDIELFNSTNESLEIDTLGLATISRLTFYYKNNYVGQSVGNIEQFVINENSSTIIRNIPVEINLINALDLLPEFINNGLPTMQTLFDNLKVNTTISAFGETYTINTI